MAAAEHRLPSPDAFLGQPWSSWIDAAKLPSTERLLSSDSVKDTGKNREVMRLNRDDMHIFGCCPAQDEFYLVMCNQCKQNIKPQAFQSHCERRHGLPRRSSTSPSAQSHLQTLPKKHKSSGGGSNSSSSQRGADGSVRHPKPHRDKPGDRSSANTSSSQERTVGKCVQASSQERLTNHTKTEKGLGLSNLIFTASSMSTCGKSAPSTSPQRAPSPTASGHNPASPTSKAHLSSACSRHGLLSAGLSHPSPQHRAGLANSSPHRSCQSSSGQHRLHGAHPQVSPQKLSHCSPQHKPNSQGPTSSAQHKAQRPLHPSPQQQQQQQQQHKAGFSSGLSQSQHKSDKSSAAAAATTTGLQQKQPQSSPQHKASGHSGAGAPTGNAASQPKSSSGGSGSASTGLLNSSPQRPQHKPGLPKSQVPTHSSPQKLPHPSPQHSKPVPGLSASTRQPAQAKGSASSSAAASQAQAASSCAAGQQQASPHDRHVPPSPGHPHRPSSASLTTAQESSNSLAAHKADGIPAAQGHSHAPGSTATSATPAARSPEHKPPSGSKSGALEPSQKANGTKKISTYKRLQDRDFDPNSHCGVWDPQSERQCTRSLTCKTHSLSQRRAVPGRRKQFDTLLAEHRAQSREREREKELQQALRDSAAQHAPHRAAQTPASTLSPARAKPSTITRHSNSPSCPGPPEPAPSPPGFSVDIGNRVWSDGEEEGPNAEPPEKLDCQYSGNHPRPHGYCTFGSRRLDSRFYAYDRRWDRCRGALTSMTERLLNAQLWRKIPPAAECTVSSPPPPALGCMLPSAGFPQLSFPPTYLPSVAGHAPMLLSPPPAFLSPTEPTFVGGPPSVSGVPFPVGAHGATFGFLDPALGTGLKPPAAHALAPPHSIPAAGGGALTGPTSRPTKHRLGKSAKLKDGGGGGGVTEKKARHSSPSCSPAESPRQQHCAGAIGPGGGSSTSLSPASPPFTGQGGGGHSTSNGGGKPETAGRTGVDSIRQMSVVVSSIDSSADVAGATAPPALSAASHHQPEDLRRPSRVARPPPPTPHHQAEENRRRSSQPPPSCYGEDGRRTGQPPQQRVEERRRTTAHSPPPAPPPATATTAQPAEGRKRKAPSSPKPSKACKSSSLNSVHGKSPSISGMPNNSIVQQVRSSATRVGRRVPL
ncbi:unnamed protein product [Lampetra fluviatilis]